jgi:hypothetical protein
MEPVGEAASEAANPAPTTAVETTPDWEDEQQNLQVEHKRSGGGGMAQKRALRPNPTQPSASPPASELPALLLAGAVAGAVSLGALLYARAKGSGKPKRRGRRCDALGRHRWIVLVLALATASTRMLDPRFLSYKASYDVAITTQRRRHAC